MSDILFIFLYKVLDFCRHIQIIKNSSLLWDNFHLIIKKAIQLAHYDSSVMHAEMKIGKNRIMMGEPTDQFGSMPVSIYMYVRNCDEMYKSALQAGGTSMMEDMTLEESKRRINKLD
ncbi:MAG: hypothetical protein WCH78_00510 [Bacteroidota bacterium]